MKATGVIHPLIKSTNYLKHNGILTSYPDIVIRVNGSEYGDSVYSLSYLDYAMYREYGFEWDKLKIPFTVINNLNGKEYEFEYDKGNLDVANIWETELFKELKPLYEQRSELIFDKQKQAASGAQHEARIKAIIEFRQEIDAKS